MSWARVNLGGSSWLLRRGRFCGEVLATVGEFFCSCPNSRHLPFIRPKPLYPSQIPPSRLQFRCKLSQLEEKGHTNKAYCIPPVFLSWLGKGTSRRLLLSMEDASRATGVTAPAGAGLVVEMARVAIAGIKVLTGAATHLLVQGGAGAKEGQYYTVVQENALSRASRGIGENMRNEGGEIGGGGRRRLVKGLSVAATGIGLAGGRRETSQR